MNAPGQPDALETAISAALGAAVRRRAAAQRQKAADGTSAVGDKFPQIVARSPEAALAGRLAVDLDAIADEIGGAQ
jgi:hypothetical protein